MDMLPINSIMNSDLLKSAPFSVESKDISQTSLASPSYFNNLIELLTSSGNLSDKNLLALSETLSDKSALAVTENLSGNNKNNFRKSAIQCCSYQNDAQLINALAASIGLLPNMNLSLITAEDSNNNSNSSIQPIADFTATDNLSGCNKFVQSIKNSFYSNQDDSSVLLQTDLGRSTGEAASLFSEKVNPSLSLLKQVSMEQNSGSIDESNEIQFNNIISNNFQTANHNSHETNSIATVIDPQIQPQNHFFEPVQKSKLPDNKSELIPEQTTLPQNSSIITKISDDSNVTSEIRQMGVSHVTDNGLSNFNGLENDTPNSSDFTDSNIEPSFFAEPNRQIVAEHDFNLENFSVDTNKPDYNLNEQIIEKVHLLTTPDNSEIVIKLKPEHLGELTLKVAVQDGQIHATFHTNNQEVRSIIETSLPQLRQDLQNNGLKVSYVNVQSGLGQFQPNDQHSNTRQAFVKMHNKKNINQFEEVNLVERIQISNSITSGVDYRV